MENQAINLIVGFGGALVGGLFTLFGTYRANKHQRNLALDNDKETVQAILHGLHSEISALMEVYAPMRKMLEEEHKEGTPFLIKYTVSTDYFSVYRGNCGVLGKIKQHDLRDEIIKFYTLANSLLDHFQMNNSQIAKYDELNTIYYHTNDEKVRLQIEIYESALVETAKQLKEVHLKAMSKQSVLLDQLKQFFGN